jgi:hypothetical protein
MFTCLSVPNLLAVIAFVLFPVISGAGGLPSEAHVIALSVGAFVFLVLLVVVERLCFFTCQSISQRRNLRFVVRMTQVSPVLLPFGPLLWWYARQVLARRAVRAQFQASVDPR